MQFTTNQANQIEVKEQARAMRKNYRIF